VMAAWRDWLVARAYFGGWRMVRLLPERAAYGLFDRVADQAWRRRGPAVRRLEGNLARVRPAADEAALRELSRAGMRSYLRYYCDAFRLPGWSRERLVDTVRTVGDEPVRELLAGGESVVMFLGHLGNWDHAGAWSTLQLHQVTTVAERLKPEAVFTAFLGFREELGMRIVPLSGHEVFRTLLSAVRAGGTFMPLLADRDLSNNGVEVEFFGERARMAAGPAALAVATGAALYPVSIHYERLDRATRARRGHGIVITWHERVQLPPGGRRGEQVAAMTQSCADALAGAISEHPQDWHMLQRVFVSDLDQSRLPATP
jgi:phosphatidylinositol dimannoside acyltransferase